MSAIKLKKAIFFCLTFVVCNFVHSFAFAQQSKVDSLLNLIKMRKVADTLHLNRLNLLAEKYNKQGAYFIAIEISEKVIDISNQCIDKHILADSTKGFKMLKSNAYSTIATSYNSVGNFPEALNNILTALKINEELNYKAGVSICYNTMGTIYKNQKNYSKALENYSLAMHIKDSLGDKKGIALCLNNVGVVYCEQGNYEESLKNYLASLKIKEELKNRAGIGYTYNNIGNIYILKRDFVNALKYHFASLKIKEELNDKNGIASSYINIGTIFSEQKKHENARKMFLNAITLSKELGIKEYLREAYGSLVEIDSVEGKYEKAYEHHKLFIKYRDSLDNEESRKKIIEAQMTFDFDKKEAATKAEQEKKDIIANEALKQKTQQRNYFILAFVLLALLALFIFRGYKQKQKANQIITLQKAEVEKAKHIIEEKNKDITDSINYAQRIQRAMLPDSEELERLFPESFILFQPKDIVSGDFYFVHENNDCVYIAASDCTGHGVPGAFMSLIGTTKLQDAVAQSVSPSDILMLLNKSIKAALKQTDGNESTRDGMDIALCVVNKQTRVLTFAGANRPLWLIRKNSKEVEEIKATKCAIGGLTSDNQHYDATDVDLAEGDTFYISTDGYADQFNGKTEKKLMTKKFKEILVDIQAQSMPEQKTFLANFINDWKEGTEQLDDILVIGVRV